LAGDWYEALPAQDRYDLIVSNPPYIAREDAHLAQGDLRFEPRGALTDENDGLAALARIAGGAPGRLLPGGAIWMEHGWGQRASPAGRPGAFCLAAPSGWNTAGTRPRRHGRCCARPGCARCTAGAIWPGSSGFPVDTYN
ncbi:hypothetical protein L560_0382, partial [Bordetella pertussis STO1-CHOC-0018]